MTGALYDDGTSGNQKADDTVQPNTTFIYRWNTGKAGPKQQQTENCIGWQYTSHRFPSQDQNAGLVGVTIICRQGADLFNIHQGGQFQHFGTIDKTFENQIIHLEMSDILRNALT